ncbi:MAG: type III-A CRISPR-associated RAMP protein Csm4 [Eubacteriales bacterium]
MSSGYGKFEVLEWVDLQETPNHVYALLKGFLERQDANRFISLTTSLPAEDEIRNVIEGSTYALIRRGGFIQSESFSKTPLKKLTQFFFAAGSTFLRPYKGDVYNVAPNGNHPVYRYSKPILLGVDL